MGCVHVYCGDGKGETSAALGLALRAAGRGWRVVVARFLKNDDSGELLPLCGIPGVEVLPCEKSFGFYRTMTDAEKAEAGEYYRELLERAWRRAEACGNGDDAEGAGAGAPGEEPERVPVLLVLDEIAAACAYSLVDTARLTCLLDSRPEFLEVVLTGRNPDEGMLERADYISEIQKRRHPYDRGLGAREGIEY